MDTMNTNPADDGQPDGKQTSKRTSAAKESQFARRSQQQRRTETSAKLRKATIELIAEQGYVNTTTIEIAERAGVSRGALMHHYPAKIDLIADSACEVWSEAISQVRLLAQALSRGQLDVDTFVEGVWDRVFPKSAVIMTLDLVSAAKSDENLQERISPPLQELFEAYDQIAIQAFAETGLSTEQGRVIVSLTTCMIRGLKLQELMHPDPAMSQAILDALKVMLAQTLKSRDTLSMLPVPDRLNSGVPI